jgi:hypothetical protein
MMSSTGEDHYWKFVGVLRHRQQGLGMNSMEAVEATTLVLSNCEVKVETSAVAVCQQFRKEDM